MSFEPAYRLTFPISNGVPVDLGASIGFTSVWLTKEYGYASVIAVEPDAGNAALARKNFDLNGIPGKILEAAIGPYDGTVRFQAAEESNLGHLSNEGKLVVSISMRSVVNRYRLSELDLAKIDIEGGEEALLTGPPEWLYRTETIIAEFHPSSVDYPALTQLLEQHGFQRIRAGTAFANNMDCFRRLNQ